MNDIILYYILKTTLIGFVIYVGVVILYLNIMNQWDQIVWDRRIQPVPIPDNLKRQKYIRSQV